MSASVSDEFLLEGAVYALEQCGLLLRDANILYRSGSYASAVALGSFAREEQGRWRILLDLRKEVVAGRKLTMEELQEQCADHVRKQQAGMTSLTMRADNDSVLGKLLQTRLSAKPGSEEWKATDEEIKKIDRLKSKRIPEDRHKLRMSALYVDPQTGGWSRPSNEVSPTSARDFLADAANDYTRQYQRYSAPEILKSIDPELFGALDQWSARPVLPRPECPPFK